MLYLSNNKSVYESGAAQYNGDYFEGAMKKNMSGYMDYAKQSRSLRMNFKILLSHIRPYLLPDKPCSVLDIGCAYGFFLDEARKLGMSVHGLDISESAIQWMEKHLGIKGTVGLSSDAPEGPFDLISAIEVIEHTADPRSFIDDIYGRLKEEGILVIVTGASDSITARVMGKKWWYLNPPDHCSIFSRVALKQLISDKGFEILGHSLVPFHWVGLNNMLLKIARIFTSQRLGLLATKSPTLVLPVVHYATQIIIARKQF